MRLPLLPRRLRVTAAVAVAAAILAASVTRPGDAVPTLGPPGLAGLEWWLHAAAYATLAVAVACAVPARSPDRLALAAAVAVAFGLLVEAVQFPVPYRTSDLVDAFVNAVGAGTASVAWHLLGVGRRLAPGPAATEPGE